MGGGGGGWLCRGGIGSCVSPELSTHTSPGAAPGACRCAHGARGPSSPEIWGFLLCKVPLQPQGPLCLPSSLQPSPGFVCPGAYPPGEHNPLWAASPGAWGPQGREGSRDFSTPRGAPAFGARTPTREGAHTHTHVARCPRGAPVPHGCPAGPLFCSVRHGCAGT